MEIELTFSLREPDREVQRNTQRNLGRLGYAVVRDHDLGLEASHRAQLHASFFNEEVLRRYDDDVPPDRLRARDVVRYDWTGDEVKLAEHGSVAIESRGDHPGRREFDRVEVLYEPILAHWLTGVLRLVPKTAKQRSGTLGVNFFRTFTNVVTKPHQDGEEYIIVYVVDKIGSGARTQLFELDTDNDAYNGELRPGELIIFRDNIFRHSTTPLVRSGDQVPQRDAMVCTINYPDTYQLD